MLNFKNKAVVVTTAAIGAVAIGTGAWAYVSIAGTGEGTANAAVAKGSVQFTASATIEDLEVAAPIVIKGTSSNPNRRIKNLTVAVDSTKMPAGCEASWFSLTNGGSTASTFGYTFATTGEETVTNTGLKITLKNVPVDQDACVDADIPLIVTAS